MSRRSNETEQIGFLLACIRNATNGKVDFEQVATECGIVSKGAAAKRFERIQKQHTANQNNNTPQDGATQIEQEAQTGKKRKREKQLSSIEYIEEEDVEGRETSTFDCKKTMPAIKAEEELEQMAISSDEPTNVEMMTKKTINESMREYRLATWINSGYGDDGVDGSSEGQTTVQESGASTDTGHLEVGELPITDMGQARSNDTDGRHDDDPEKEVLVITD